jgi:hypothetical protein
MRSQVNNCKFDVWIQTSMCISNNFKSHFICIDVQFIQIEIEINYLISSWKKTGMHKFT